MKFKIKNLLAPFYLCFLEKDIVFNIFFNILFYITLVFNLYALFLFGLKSYPFGILALMAKLFALLPTLLIYTIPIIFTISKSKLRLQIYWVLLFSLTLNNFVYMHYFKEYVIYIIFLVFIVFVIDYIFATNNEIQNLSNLRQMPYIYYEKKILKSLFFYGIGSLFLFTLYAIFINLELGFQIIALYFSFVNTIFVLLYIIKKRLQRRLLTFSQGKLILFLQIFKVFLFDIRIIVMFLLSVIKNFPFFIVALFGSSLYLDRCFVFCSYLLGVLLVTLMVSYPETQEWNKNTFNKKGLRLLGFNMLRGILAGTKYVTVGIGATGVVGALGAPVYNSSKRNAMLTEAQKDYVSADKHIENEWEKQRTSYSVTHPLYDFHIKNYINAKANLGQRPQLKDIPPVDCLRDLKKDVFTVFDIKDRVDRSFGPKKKN